MRGRRQLHDRHPKVPPFSSLERSAVPPRPNLIELSSRSPSPAWWMDRLGALSVLVDHRARVMSATDSVPARRRDALVLAPLCSSHDQGDATFEGLHCGTISSYDALTFVTNAPTPIGQGDVVRVVIDRDDIRPSAAYVALSDRGRVPPESRLLRGTSRASIQSGMFGKRSWLVVGLEPFLPRR